MKKVEKIDDELLNKLTELQKRINEIIISFGEIYVAKLEVESELSKVKTQQDNLEVEYKRLFSAWEAYMDELSKKYNDGELNLIEGTVTYDE